MSTVWRKKKRIFFFLSILKWSEMYYIKRKNKKKKKIFTSQWWQQKSISVTKKWEWKVPKKLRMHCTKSFHPQSRNTFIHPGLTKIHQTNDLCLCIYIYFAGVTEEICQFHALYFRHFWFFLFSFFLLGNLAPQGILYIHSASRCAHGTLQRVGMKRAFDRVYVYICTQYIYAYMYVKKKKRMRIICVESEAHWRVLGMFIHHPKISPHLKVNIANFSINTHSNFQTTAVYIYIYIRGFFIFRWCFYLVCEH